MGETNCWEGLPELQAETNSECYGKRCGVCLSNHVHARLRIFIVHSQFPSPRMKEKQHRRTREGHSNDRADQSDITPAATVSATLLRRRTTRARQHCVTLWSPREYRISSARRAFGNPDAGHLHRERAHCIICRSGANSGAWGQGKGHCRDSFALSRKSEGVHLKVALSGKRAWASSGRLGTVCRRW
jgi:hypothetical protein